MLGKASLVLCIAMHIGCVEPAAEMEDDVVTEGDGDADGDGKADVYGTDDRKDRYQYASTSLARRLAKSSAMLAYRYLVRPRTDGNYELFEPRTLAQTGVCADERFANQPEVGFCSATLIAPDLVVTSGHCMMNSFGSLATAKLKCADLVLVFDFAYDTAPTNPLGALRVLPGGDVYKCVDVLAVEHPDLTVPKHDYAILKLDRPVTDRLPLPVYGGADLPSYTAAIQVGHPSGLPQKIAPASTRARIDATRYRYRADVLGGNSGGGVFTTYGTLFGIPTRYSGQNYVLDTSTTPECYRTAVCGVNAECPVTPGVYDTAAMLKRLPTEIKSRLSIKTR